MEKLCVKSKQVVSTLVLIYFGRPPIGHTIKENCKTFQTVDLKKCPILILKRCLGLAFSPCFLYNFFRKIFLMLYSIMVRGRWEGESPTLILPVTHKPLRKRKLLTYFKPLVSFYNTSWKHQKTRGFFMFSGG